VLQKFADEHEDLAVEMIVAQASFIADRNEGPRALEMFRAALAEYPDDNALRVRKLCCSNA